MLSTPASTAAAALPRLEGVQRNFALDLSSGVGLGATMAVVGVLLPSLARRQGLDSMGLAVLAALPFLASLVTLFAGRVGPRTPARMAVLRALGALSLLIVLVAPDPLFIAVAILGYWIAFSLGAPLQQRIWATIYPTRTRGRLLGYIGTGRSAAGFVSLLAITLAAASAGWAAIIAVVALVGAVLALSLSRLAVPGIEVNHRFSAGDSIRSVLSEPTLRSVTLAQLLFGAGFVVAPALIAMVHVDRLGLGVQQIALAGLVAYGTTAATFSLWGRLASRVGGLTTIALGTIFGVEAMALFAFAPDFATVLLATMLLGAAGASVDTAWPLLIADYAPADQQSEVSAGLNSMMGLRGLITPFLILAPVYTGLTDVTGALLIAVACMASGALLYARLAGLATVPQAAMGRLAAWAQRRPASSLTPASSISGWPVRRLRRLMRSTIAGWVLKRPRALLSSFLTGLTM